jgi:hypothetical protein
LRHGLFWSARCRQQMSLCIDIYIRMEGRDFLGIMFEFTNLKLNALLW